MGSRERRARLQFFCNTAIRNGPLLGLDFTLRMFTFSASVDTTHDIPIDCLLELSVIESRGQS